MSRLPRAFLASCTLLLPLAAQDWHRVSSGGSGGIVAYDPVRQRLVLYDDEYFTFGTWEWDGIEWALCNPVTSPTWRVGASMAFDPVSQRVILFGGIEGTSYLSQTWAWDGTTWERLFPARSPAPRGRAAMVVDEARGRLLLFGGENTSCGAGPCPLGDLWEWDGSDWVQLAGSGGANRPAPVSGPRLAYDASRQRVVLFGGDQDPSTGIPFGETWEWDGAVWTRITTTTSPVGRTLHAMAYDPVSSRVVLYGGVRNVLGKITEYQDTWDYDGSDWRLVQRGGRPGVVQGNHLIFDPSIGRLVLVAGANWQYTGTGWTLPSFVPGPHRNPALAFDAVRGRTVMYAGGPATTGGPATEVWEWDGLQWIRKTPPVYPGFTARQSMAYDAARGVCVMLFPNGTPTTWTWNGEAWRLRGPAPAEGQLAYDAARGVVVELANDGQTWTWDGSAWTRHETTGPPSRQGHAMAYDAARQVVVMFGGTTDPTVSSASLADTWEWNGTSWTQAAPASAPPARFDHGMAYDPTRGTVMMAGGPGDTWEWDGVSWSQVTTTQGPSGIVDLAFDSRRGRLVAVEAKWLGSTPYALRLWEFGVITPASASSSGQGCGGTAVPWLGTLGVPRVGRTTFAIDVLHAPASAPGVLIFAAGTASLPLGSGCTLYVDPTASVSLPFVADASGNSSHTVPVPGQIPIGAALYVQGLLLDPSSPLGLALTSRLDLAFGE